MQVLHWNFDFSVNPYVQRYILLIDVSPICYAVKRTEVPGVGDSVHVSSLGKKATVLKVEPSKEEIVVQVGNMKLKLKLTEIKS